MRAILLVAAVCLLAGCAQTGSPPQPPPIGEPLSLAPQVPVTLEINASALSHGTISGWLHITNPTAATLYIQPLIAGRCGLLDVIVQDLEVGAIIWTQDFGVAVDCLALPDADATLVALPAGTVTRVPFTGSSDYIGIMEGHHVVVTVTHRPALHDHHAVTLPLWSAVVSATAVVRAQNDVPRMTFVMG
ncbi:MAG: hypothetical protein V4510_06850 [bacterium]